MCSLTVWHTCEHLTPPGPSNASETGHTELQRCRKVRPGLCRTTPSPPPPPGAHSCSCLSAHVECRMQTRIPATSEAAHHNLHSPFSGSLILLPETQGGGAGGPKASPSAPSAWVWSRRPASLCRTPWKGGGGGRGGGGGGGVMQGVACRPGVLQEGEEELEVAGGGLLLCLALALSEQGKQGVRSSMGRLACSETSHARRESSGFCFLPICTSSAFPITCTLPPPL